MSILIKGMEMPEGGFLALEIGYDADGNPMALTNKRDVYDVIPAADVRENKRGKWDDKKVAFYFKCSECGCCVRAFAGEVFLDYAQEWNFCPNCGADMRGEQT